MLGKDFDFALVGHNYITFLLSLGLLKKGKKVLILDDDRFNYGEFFTNSLTLLDVEFLKVWGESADIGPLKNIDQYLSAESMYVFIGKKQVVLGDSPFRNYRELARKFPNLFLNEKSGSLIFDTEVNHFNQKYQDFCRGVSQNIFNENKSYKISKMFESSIPENLAFQFQNFFNFFDLKDSMSEVQKSEFNTFVYLARGFFQSRLSTSGTRSEIMHLFFSLLSPYFKLDHDRLINDLLQVHQQMGGEFKKLNLSDLKLQRGLVKSFELDSFEGLIRPKKMAFIGGYPIGLPIKLKTSSTSYNCLNVKLNFTHDLPKLIQDKKLIFSSSLKIGTDRPFFEVYFKNHYAYFNIVITKREASKVSFIEARIIESLKEDLRFLYPEFNFEIKDFSLQYTLDVFLEDRDFEAHKKEEKSLGNKIVEVLGANAPLILTRLKNVLYFGPYNDAALGTFSSLIEIKKWREVL
jgi:hypothetical protein